MAYCLPLTLSCRKRSAEQELTALLKEKEEQITGLMEEGETSLPLWRGYRLTLSLSSLTPYLPFPRAQVRSSLKRNYRIPTL